MLEKSIKSKEDQGMRGRKGRERGDRKIGNQCHMGKAAIRLHHLDNCGTVGCDTCRNVYTAVSS
jgi:hypothetical protein